MMVRASPSPHKLFECAFSSKLSEKFADLSAIDDLHELAEFLEVTYRIRAERHHLELLILKVLPLMSINSKIFLNGLLTAFEGPLVNPSPHLDDQPEIWRLFLLRLLRHDYVLPGTIEQLGDRNFSWISQW